MIRLLVSELFVELCARNCWLIGLRKPTKITKATHGYESVWDNLAHKRRRNSEKKRYITWRMGSSSEAGKRWLRGAKAVMLPCLACWGRRVSDMSGILKSANVLHVRPTLCIRKAASRWLRLLSVFSWRCVLRFRLTLCARKLLLDERSSLCNKLCLQGILGGWGKVIRMVRDVAGAERVN